MEVAPSFGMYFAVLGDFMCYSPVPEGKSCVAIVGLRISAKLLSAKLCLDGKPPSYIGLWQHERWAYGSTISAIHVPRFSSRLFYM